LQQFQLRGITDENKRKTAFARFKLPLLAKQFRQSSYDTVTVESKSAVWKLRMQLPVGVAATVDDGVNDQAKRLGRYRKERTLQHHRAVNAQKHICKSQQPETMLVDCAQ
jgi:hypothetical protein